MNNVDIIVLETTIIGDFLGKWATENPSINNLQEHNSKFKKEFNEFLLSQNFSKETNDLFLVV